MEGYSIIVLVTDDLDKQYTKEFMYRIPKSDIQREELEAINKMISEVNYNGYTLREVIGMNYFPPK